MIIVNDTWYIDVDSDNYSVGKLKNVRKVTDKNGKEREEHKYEGYFTNLESALKFIRNQMTAEALSADMYLPEAIARVMAINREFVEAFERAVAE